MGYTCTAETVRTRLQFNRLLLILTTTEIAKWHRLVIVPPMKAIEIRITYVRWRQKWVPTNWLPPVKATIIWNPCSITLTLKSIYIDRRPPTRIHRQRKAIEPAWVGQRYSTTTVRPGSGLATKPRLSNPNNISGTTVNTVACIDNAITADD